MHLSRYRITTPEILHKLFFTDSEQNAVTKVTSRLTQHQFICRHNFIGQRSYFTLGTAACKILGITTKKAKKLGPQALTHEYGTLAYCFNTSPPRQRLLVSEIEAKDNQLLGRGLDSSHYYIDIVDDVRRLGLIRVEQGSTPELIVKKCQREIDKRLKFAAFHHLISNQLFLIAIATSTEFKQQQIHTCLRRKQWPIPFRVEVIPELVQLNAKSII